MRSLVPLHYMRQNLALGEFPHATPQLLLLLAKGKVHYSLGSLNFRVYLAKVWLISILYQAQAQAPARCGRATTSSSTVSALSMPARSTSQWVTNRTE